MPLHVTASAVLGLSLTVGASATVGTTASPPQTRETTTADFLARRMAESGVPGMAYAIVGADGIHEMGAWGTDGDGDDVTTDTPFLWGSVSKPVTATAVMTLVEDGTVDLGEPVRTYLPAFRLADTDAARQVTVRHLLTQTSGIPEGTGVTDRFGQDGDPYRSAVAGLADVEPKFAPGTRHEYASENYLVLGALVEAVSGMSYTRYLRENVLGPLDMDGAVTSPEGADQRLPAGHRYVAGQAVAFDAPYDPTGPSYGYLGGTITDLAHFAVAQLAEGRYGDSRVLDAGTVSRMQQGTAHISDTHCYGLGWRDDDRNTDLGTSTVWHLGAAPGYQAGVVLLPEKELGIVVLQNVYGFFQDSELAAAQLGAARILAGGDPAERSGGAAYPALLAGLTVLVAALAALTGWSLWRPRRDRHARSRARLAITTVSWCVSCAAVAFAAGVLLPWSVGTDLGVMPLYAPDVAWLLVAVVITASALALTRLGVALVRWRRPRVAR
ncbi:CubicO group peptidase (beta-lactamase class C family) [Haloactinopolyspora alba]|uniref:CubicO group peptidase (Beta-lactamase class C family) n=1 Tax=Haloactinopolyspora alba TaxID=648780 RepID=A0A2P8DYX5_9ACTN|nr:serine hydrolase domain-containing protein [Haloactinopolyspora alba]PSL02377.1 CubicO group peptidase (beta-lactamase class C family) [Haloactinopolyspora alba]